VSTDATDPAATAEAEPVRTADVEVEASRLVRIIAAVVLVVLSATFLVGVFDIRSPKGLDPQGPRFFPLLVTVAWLLLSIGYLIEGLRSPRTTKAPAEAGDITDRSWFEPVALCVLLVLYAFLVVPLGYMIATAALFWGAARVLGSRQLVRDIVVAVVMAVVVYIAFTQFLDISLPEGVLGL
jgi:putative tricarboxylic transport membrane protein